MKNAQQSPSAHVVTTDKAGLKVRTSVKAGAMTAYAYLVGQKSGGS